MAAFKVKAERNRLAKLKGLKKLPKTNTKDSLPPEPTQPDESPIKSPKPVESSEPVESLESSESSDSSNSPEPTVSTKSTKSDKPKSQETNVNDTLFIRNLSYDTDGEGLKKFVEETFGPTVYCLICRDKETDESKGTGFVKFKDPQDAAKCLADFRDRDMVTKFHLDGRNFIVLKALTKDGVKDMKEESSKTKDKRNLDLAKQGYIHVESEEAKDLSKSDVEKRRTLHLRKREMLKNLHNFVSDTRLCVHNLPAHIDDVKLRKIFKSAVQDKHPGAKITECRVMRNKNGSGQLGTSKGFGFVSFNKHEYALASLKSINNNPTTFSKEKRPIVEFSVENMVALNKKKTRLANSLRKIKAKTVATETEKPEPKSKGPFRAKKGSFKARRLALKLKKAASNGVNPPSNGPETTTNTPKAAKKSKKPNPKAKKASFKSAAKKAAKTKR